MARPIITGFTAEPATVAPGGAFVATIEAHDPDQRTGTLKGVVTDAAGNVAEAVVQLAIADPLTFELVDVDRVGFTITPRAGAPGRFDVKAP